MATQESPNLRVSVGTLSDVGSLYRNVSRHLRKYNELYRQGQAPVVEWDLRGLQYRRISMAALTAFLSMSDRMRQYSDHPQYAMVHWNPPVFTFLDDIRFFDIVKSYDLLTFPPGLVGGYQTGKTNPNTRLLVFDNIGTPDISADDAEIHNWKASTREQFAEVFKIRCGVLFQGNPAFDDLPTHKRNQVALTAAELVVNSLLWGRAKAFVGVQRTSARVTIAVCDSGVGFLRSIRTNRRASIGRNVNDSLEALIVGALVNSEEYGLHRAIDLVVSHGGLVTMSSDGSEVQWRQALWSAAKAASSVTSEGVVLTKDFAAYLHSAAGSRITEEQKEYGYVRRWPNSIRGTRVSFEVFVNR